MPFKIQHTPDGYYVVSKQTGTRHSKTPLDYDTASRQLRALYRQTGQEPKGGDFLEMVKSIPERVYGLVQDIRAPELADVINVREAFSPADTQVIDKYKDVPIVSMRVVRTPINKYINLIIKALSNGKFQEEAKKKGYDTLFHLYLEIYLQGVPNPLLFEKNDTARLTENPPELTKYSQTMTVPNVAEKGLTLDEFLTNSINAMGSDFWRYRWDTLNCQGQIKKCLEANGLLTPELNKFIVQDVINAGKTLSPAVRAGFQGITDLSAIGRRVFGLGFENEND